MSAKVYLVSERLVIVVLGSNVAIENSDKSLQSFSNVDDSPWSMAQSTTSLRSTTISVISTTYNTTTQSPSLQHYHHNISVPRHAHRSLLVLARVLGAYLSLWLSLCLPICSVRHRRHSQSPICALISSTPRSRIRLSSLSSFSSALRSLKSGKSARCLRCVCAIDAL